MKNKCRLRFIGNSVSTSVILNTSLRPLDTQFENKKSCVFEVYYGGLWLHNTKLKNKNQNKIQRILCSSYSRTVSQTFCHSSVNSTKFKSSIFSMVRSALRSRLHSGGDCTPPETADRRLLRRPQCGMFSSNKIIDISPIRRMSSLYCFYRSALKSKDKSEDSYISYPKYENKYERKYEARFNSQTKKYALNKTKIMCQIESLQTHSIDSKSHNISESAHSFHSNKMKDYSKLFLNCVFDKGRLKAFVIWFLRNHGQKKTIELLEQLKQIGFGYATKAGISLGIDDLKIPVQKKDLLINAQALIHEGSVQYKRGEITGVEKFQRLIDTWHQTSENLKQEVIRHFEATDLLNPVYMMAFSGARGNISQVRQLVGMRGLMADPQGQIIDFPIRSNFREGLTLTEYIISSYGARKGIVDTALRTANAGYLTRRLVDVAQHVIVSEFDCKTNRGILVLDMKEGNKTIYSFQNRLLGRVLAKNIFHEQQKIASKNQEVSTELANSIAKITKKALIRSPLTCETKKSVCQLCYGWSLSTSSLVSIGEAVGIIAAQSIGEPGTQLTMRTFHTGGVFSGGLSEQIIAPNDGIIEYSAPIPGICVRTPQGQIAFLTKTQGCLIFKTSFCSSSADSTVVSGGVQAAPQTADQSSSDVKTPDSTHTKIWNIPPYTVLFAKNKQKVFKKQLIAQLSSFSLSGEIQKTPKGDAEQTIYALFEGQIHNSNIDVIEKFNEYHDLTFEAWGWGYLWILAGKMYQYPIQSHIFAQPGDFIGKNSVLNRIQWMSNDEFLLNPNLVNSTQSNISSGRTIYSFNSMSYAQNKFNLSHNPRELEMEKTSDFFQPIGSMKKNIKLSIPTRYEKNSNTKKISYHYSKNLIGPQINKLNSLKFHGKFEKNSFDEQLLDIRRNHSFKHNFESTTPNTRVPMVPTKIHSIRLIRAKFFRKKFEVDYWKFIDSSNKMNDFVYYSNQYEQKVDLSNFHYPFHQFLRKRLSMKQKKKWSVCGLRNSAVCSAVCSAVQYKIRNRYSRKRIATKTANCSHKNNLQKRNKVNRLNRIYFLQRFFNKRIEDFNEKSKYNASNFFNRNFRMPIKNQNKIFVSDQLSYLKRWKSLKSVYPYVNKKTIKKSIFPKFMNFRKNRFLLHDVIRKSNSADSKTIIELAEQRKNTNSSVGDEQPFFMSNFNTTLKAVNNVQNKNHFKTFHCFRKKQHELTRLLSSHRRCETTSSMHIRHGLRNKNNKNNSISNKSNEMYLLRAESQIVQHDRNPITKSCHQSVARHSKKVASLNFKKPVLSLSLKTFRYQKLGYHFSHDFLPRCGMTKSINDIKPSSYPISVCCAETQNVKKYSESDYSSTKLPLNFGFYAPNKNKDEFFNEFSLKTSHAHSIDSLAILRNKQNTYEWSPTYSSFLQWFPSCNQTLNNGMFIFSGISLTSAVSSKTKNSNIFASNRKKNNETIARPSQQTQIFKLNCHQFKRKSTSHQSKKKIHHIKHMKKTKHKSISKPPILKKLHAHLKVNHMTDCVFRLPKSIYYTPMRDEFNANENFMYRIKKKTLLVEQIIMPDNDMNKNEFDFSNTDKIDLIEKQTKHDLLDKIHDTKRVCVLSSNIGNKTSYSLHKTHDNFKKDNKSKKRNTINPSFVYSLNMFNFNSLKKNKHDHTSNFVYKSLDQLNFYDFNIHGHEINSKTSTSKNKFIPLTGRGRAPISRMKFKNQLRWKNKKPKLSVNTKSFSRVTKKNIARASDFRKKTKISNVLNMKHHKKSNFASFNPRLKFSVSWNEIFWTPQEDYQISVWPLSFKTDPNFVQHSLESLPKQYEEPNKDDNKNHPRLPLDRAFPLVPPRLYSSDLKNERKNAKNTKVNQIQKIIRNLASNIYSTDFMNQKSRPLFYLNNRQGLKKPFYSKLDGFSNIFIKPINAISSIKSPFLLNNERATSPLNTLNTVITNTTKNKSEKINISNTFYSIDFKAFIDFSQKNHPLHKNVSYKFIPKNSKQNAIHDAPHSLNKINQNLKSYLMNFIKNKWQMNDEKQFHFKKQSKNMLSFFHHAHNKFVSKNPLYLINAPITKSFPRQKNFFSHFVFENLNIVKNTLIERKNRMIKQRFDSTNSNGDLSLNLNDNVAFSSAMTLSNKNQTHFDQKMRISIQPGWVYYSLNTSKITKCHQKIVDFGKFVADDLLFTNHRVYIKNIVLRHSPVNKFARNSKYAKVSLDNNVVHEFFGKPHECDRSVFFDENVSRSRNYSFNLNDCVSLCPMQNQNIDEIFAFDCFYDFKTRISNSKSRFGDFILKHSTNLLSASSNTSIKIQYSDSTVYDHQGDTSSNFEQKQNVPEKIVDSFAHYNDSLAILIKPMHHKILPNLHFYKTKIHRANKKSLESTFSILTHKNFLSHFLNKQKCDKKFIPTFPGIDMRIFPNSLHCALSSQIKKAYFMNNIFSRASQNADTFYSKNLIFSNTRQISKTSKKPVRRFFSSVNNQRLKNTFHSIDRTSKNDFSFCKTTSGAFNISSTRRCFEQTYLTLYPMNFLPLNLKFSSPSSFNYLFKIPSFNFNSSTNMSFVEQQKTKRLGSLYDNKFRNYILTDLVSKNQQRLSDTNMHALMKPHQSIISYTDSIHSIETKLFLDSLTYSSFLPRFDFYLSAKMSYLANQRLFASYLNSREFSSVSNKNSSLLESFGDFPVSQNQIYYFQSNKIFRNQPFAITSFKSPLIGEMLYKPSKNWSSEANQNRCLLLTESDLFCFYLPSMHAPVNTTIAYNQRQTNDFPKFSNKKYKKNPNVYFSVLENSSDIFDISSEQTKFQNKFSSLYQNFSQLEKIHSDQFNEQKTTSLANECDKNANIIVQYNEKFYKIKGLRIGAIKSSQKLRLGSFLVYGDFIASNAESAFAIDEAGQIIHMNCSKVTFRRAQPISVSPKGILHAYNQDFVAQNAAVITLPFQTLKTGDIVQGIPKVEQYFEARTTKRGRLYRDSLPNLLRGLFERYRTLLPLEKAVRQSILKIQQIIVDGVQRVYRSQGVSISDKHLEVIVRQMTSKVQIVHGGQTGFFPGELVDLEFVEHVNQFLLKKIHYEPVILGITRASLEVESFLSAASFQQTTKVLSKAAVYRKKDFLKGLKENIIVGNLIPGGTGYLVHLKEFFNMRSKQSNV